MKAVQLDESYAAPGSYETQTHVYVVEWIDPDPRTPHARGCGTYFGNGLVSLPRALELAAEAIETRSKRLLDEAGIAYAQARLQEMQGKHGKRTDDGKKEG